MKDIKETIESPEFKKIADEKFPGFIQSEWDVFFAPFALCFVIGLGRPYLAKNRLFMAVKDSVDLVYFKS